jgi:hypothetical protein
MLKSVQKTPIEDISFSSLASQLTRVGKARALGVLCGPVALAALAWATPVVPALAQSAPAGLLRLDPPPGSYYGEQFAQDRHERALGAYARIPDGYGMDAVRNCMQRFRSYDSGSGTYLGYDGNRHPCP